MLEKLKLRNLAKKAFNVPVEFLIKKTGYKVLIILVLLSSCQKNNSNKDTAVDSSFLPESKNIINSPKENSFDKYFVGERAGIKIFKDTLFLPPSSKYSYTYSKYDNDLEVSKNLEELEKILYLFPPKFRGIFHEKKDTIFITKSIVRNGDTLEGVYQNYLFLSTMKRLPHEISHVIDEVLQKDDAEWGEAFYGKNYQEHYKKTTSGRPLGFSSAYAQRSVKEDRAETFSDLMLRHEWKLHPNDKTLQAKIKKMKEELFEIDNEFTKQYWGNLDAGKVNKKYWKNK